MKVYAILDNDESIRVYVFETRELTCHVCAPCVLYLSVLCTISLSLSLSPPPSPLSLTHTHQDMITQQRERNRERERESGGG